MKQTLASGTAANKSSAQAARRTSTPTATLRRLAVPIGLLLLWQIVTWLGVFERSQLPGPLAVLAAGRQDGACA